MYRRSNSSANLPVRSNLFGIRETGIPGPTGGRLRRSQSSSRLNHNENNANKKTKRNSSLDRKSSLTRLSKLTPLSKMTPMSKETPTPSNLQKRMTNSVTKSTPVSSTMSKRRLTQPSATKERKTIQKLASDKKWVAEQYAKVQNFIIISNCFDVNFLDSANNLKPPSIKNFIYVTNILLQAIFSNVNMRNENYKEVITEKLKVLKYPGKLANSTLISVNTMNSWPQVIGMWGFLIDKINSSVITDDGIMDNLDSEGRQKALKAKACWDFVVERHSLFNTSDSDGSDKIRAVNDGYVKKLSEILNVNYEEYSTLKVSLSKMEESQKEIDADVKILSEKKENLESQIKGIKKEIDSRTEIMAQQQKEMEEELSSLHKAIDKIRIKRETIEAHIETLKEAIKVQPCTYAKKVELLQKNENLRKEIGIIKGKISHAQKIKNEYDENLNKELSMLQNKVIEWNKALLEDSIKKPHLKKLMLRETGFHKPNFLDEIKKMVDEKIIIDNEIIEKIGKIDAELKEAITQKKSLEMEIHSVENRLEQIEEDLLEKTALNNLLEKQLEQTQMNWELEKKAIRQDTHNQQTSELIEVKKDETMKLESELKDLRENLTELANNVLYFFSELNGQARQNINEMRGIMESVENRLTHQAERNLDNQEARLEALKNITNLNKKFK